ncbi:MAG: Crp/Fnr family transcriptional regulator, partial [Pseudomonadota bacterium]
MSALAAHLATVVPDWPSALIDTVAAGAATMHAPDGARVFGPGDPCERFVVVLSGAVRVEQVGSAGRSIVLYRVGAGDSCVMTTSGLLSGVPYDAWGIAEGAVEILAIPAPTFRSLIDGNADFRAKVLSVFSYRILELSQVIDDLLVRRVDLRLAGWLFERSAEDTTLTATHQSIAAELGSAREVISRILKDFERRGWVVLRRGAIEVTDREALHRLET